MTAGIWRPGPEGACAGYWQMIGHLLACRSGGRCEAGGEPFDAVNQPSIHHRVPRGMGGTSDPGVHDLHRLLYVCGGRLAGVQGHHGYLEANRELAYRMGWLVPMGVDPAEWPLILPGGRRVLLDPVALEYKQAPGAPYAALRRHDNGADRCDHLVRRGRRRLRFG